MAKSSGGRGPSLRGGDKGPFPRITKVPTKYDSLQGNAGKSPSQGGKGPALAGGNQGKFPAASKLPTNYGSLDGNVK